MEVFAEAKISSPGLAAARSRSRENNSQLFSDTFAPLRYLTSKLADLCKGYANSFCAAHECRSHHPHRPKKEKENHKGSLFLWSKCGDSNSRPPVPEASRSSLLTAFIYFLVLFSPKVMLSDALVRTVSAQSKSVDGQRCGQAEFSSQKPSHDYSKLISSGD